MTQKEAETSYYITQTDHTLPLQYVLGFAFNADITEVALILKQKPEWQKNMLNGIGGKIEATDDSEVDAMQREFAEETSVNIATWQKVAKIVGKKLTETLYTMHIFTAILTDDLWDSIRTNETEEIIKVAVDDITYHNVLYNIPMFIELCKITLTNGAKLTYDIIENVTN